MTIAVSYLSDLSRVRIALSGLADGTVLVERSATAGFQLPVTVRGGVTLPISGGVGQLDDYEFYADVQNWYRITPIDPPGSAETDSITPSLDGHPWLKSIKYPLQNTAVRVSDYGDIQNASRAAAFSVEGRALPTGVFELSGGRDHTLILRTTDQATEDHLKVMVRTGDWFYIHVPTVGVAGREGNLLLPGSMYVMMGTPTIHRIGGVSGEHLISLPLTEVTAPGPDVVGTTLTVGGLVALHGSVTSVWAAYPTIRDLWDTIGSLDDLVVI